MVYLKLIFGEAHIIIKYALFPTILSLLLTFVDWNYGMVMSAINLFVFLRLLHNEDQRTGILHFRYIFIKLLTATLVCYLTQYAGNVLEDSFLPPGLYARSRSRPDAQAIQDGLLSSSKMIKISRSKVKTLLSLKTSDIWLKAKFFIVRICIEYLFVANTCASYRFCFLLLIFCIYGVIHLAIWYFVPAPKYDHGGDSDSSDSDEEGVDARLK